MSTHHPRANNKQPSTIDLGITNCPYPVTNLNTHPLGSDHSVVTFSIQFDENVQLNSPHVRPCYSLANWDRYKVLLENKFRHLNFDHHHVISTNHIDELITLLTESMHWAGGKSIPLKPVNKYALQLTSAIQSKIIERGNVERRWQRCNNLLAKTYLKNIMNQLTAEIKFEVSAIRNDNWAAKLSSIKDDENRKGLWQVSKFIKKRGNNIPPLKVDDVLLTTPEEKANSLANTFALAHANPLSDEDPTFTTQVENEVRAFCDVLPNPDDIELPTLVNTEAVVRGLKSSKSPGLDGINNRLIKNLPASGILLLHLIIVSCFKLCYFPDSWKLANVKAIKKPGKNPSEPTSYRPISLLSSLSKVLERVILSRISLFTDENDVLPPEQHGFVRGKSTIHQLKRLTDHIKAGFTGRNNNKKSTGMILVDVERAFDRVWHAGLLKKMIDANYPKYLVFLTRSFLSSRSFFVNIEGAKSNVKLIPFGVPQGAVLSPSLYNIYTADVPETVLNCQRGFFADDTGLWVTASKCAEITKSLRENFKRYMEYYKKWKITLNVAKTQAIFFTWRRSVEVPRVQHLYINRECRIKWDSDVKYLGLKLDKKLLFKCHIQHAIEKANKAIGLLYPLISRNSSLSTDNKLLLYKVALRPTWSYGCQIYKTAAPSNLKRLQVLQNKSIKMCLGLPWRTSTDEVHELAKIERTGEYIDKLTQNFLNRLTAEEGF